MHVITSLQNPKIKDIVRLSKHKERQEQNLFIIEGAREFMLAREGRYTVDSVYICPELFSSTDYPRVLEGIAADIQYEVSAAVFDKIAYRTGSDGLLVLARPKQHGLDQLELPANPFIIVLESVEKPGNLGAILRTADAAKVDAVIVCDAATDLYNPNAVRSSVGCLFTVQVAVCTSQQAFGFLHGRRINTFAAELEASQWYHDTDFTQPSAIIMGTEADGLTSFWLENAGARIKIPMRGKIDSLNVSVSTAVITFEAMRQRRFE